MTFTKHTWTREALERHSVDMRQFIDFRQASLPNGSRIIEAHNGSGLTFSLLPDRGMDIWAAHYKGIPLSWLSQGSPHAPDWGQGWLRLFNGGLLTTCGLTHVGPPETDDISGEQRDIHGNFTRLQAEHISTSGDWWDDRGAEQYYELNLTSTLHESRLFGEQYLVTRTYTLVLGKPEIKIATTVKNLSDAPTPLMLVHHFNLGYPLISESTQLVTANAGVYPRDDRATPYVADWENYHAATEGYPEQVFFHHPKTHPHKKLQSQWSKALLKHGNFGLLFSWNAANQPYLTQWKNTRNGIYVCGVEPGNCIPEGQNSARATKRLHYLAAGAEETFTCVLSIIDGEAAMEDTLADIADLKQNGMPAENFHLDDYVKHE
jgi:galactose mutarotase-like enzyme